MIKCPFNCGVHVEDRNLLVCRPNGKLTEDRMNDIAICRECIQKSGLTHIDRFHDLTGITSIDLRFEDVKHICDIESQLRKPERPVKACYLVPNALLYGTIRMYAALIESCGVEVHVSYKLDELASLLGVDTSVLTAKPV